MLKKSAGATIVCPRPRRWSAPGIVRCPAMRSTSNSMTSSTFSSVMRPPTNSGSPYRGGSVPTRRRVRAWSSKSASTARTLNPSRAAARAMFAAVTVLPSPGSAETTTNERDPPGSAVPSPSTTGPPALDLISNAVARNRYDSAVDVEAASLTGSCVLSPASVNEGTSASRPASSIASGWRRSSNVWVRRAST